MVRALQPSMSCEGIQDPTAVIALMLLFLFALLFGIFTLVMLWEQLSSIFEDVTTIESFKGTPRKRARCGLCAALFADLLQHAIFRFPCDYQVPRRLY